MQTTTEAARLVKPVPNPLASITVRAQRGAADHALWCDCGRHRASMKTPAPGSTSIGTAAYEGGEVRSPQGAGRSIAAWSELYRNRPLLISWLVRLQVSWHRLPQRLGARNHPFNFRGGMDWHQFNFRVLRSKDAKHLVCERLTN